MATAVSKAGTDGSAGLSKLDSAASKSSSTLSALKGAVTGLTGSALVGFLSDSAHAAAESEASAARLDAAFQAVGKSADQYSDALAKASDRALQLGFDDEDASDAIARMTAIMGNAGDAIKSLAAAEELSRARGISLAQAADLIAKGYVGQTGALSRYGIVLDSTAKGMAVVDQVQKQFAGNADAYANTLQGAFDRAGVAFENFQESVGAIEGPLAGVIGLLPGMSAGFSGVSASVGAISTSFKEGGVAATVLGAALSPVGLALGAVGIAAAAGVIVWNDYETQLAEFSKGAASARQEIESTASSLDSLKTAAESAMAAPNLGLFDTFRLGLSAIGKDTTDYLLTAKQANDANQGLADSFHNLGASMESDVITAFSALYQQFQAGDVKAADLASTWKQVGDAADYMGYASGRLHQDLDKVIEDFASGATSPQQFMTQVAGVTAEMNRFQTMTITSASALSTWGAMAEGGATGLQVLTANAIKAGAEWEKQQADVLKVAAAYDEAKTGTEAFAGVLGGLVQQGDSVTAVLDRIAHASDQYSASAADAMEKVQAQGQALQSAQSGLESILNLYKEVDDLAGTSGDAKTIAENLVGDPNVYAAVDDWFNKVVQDSAGMADGTQRVAQAQQMYNDALAAGYDIEQQDLQVQQDAQTVRIAMLPVLDQQEQALRAQYDALAQLATTNPLLAEQQLYFMNSADSAKVAAQFSLAYAGSLGQIPKDVVTEMVIDAAKADPILAGILENYGLIEKGADGTLSINFPQKSDLDDVVSSIDALKDTNIAIAMALTGDVDGAKQVLATVEANNGQTFTVTLDAIDQASQKLNPVFDTVTTLDGTTANAVLGITDNASGPIAAVQGELRATDGSVGSVTIRADTQPAQDSVDTFTSSVAKNPITIPVEIDLNQQLQGDPLGIGANLPKPQATSQTVTTKAELDTTDFDAGIGHVQASLDSLANLTVTPHISIEDDGFTAALNQAQSELTTVSRETASVTITADIGDATRSIQTVEQEADGWGKQTYTAQLNASDNAEGLISTAQSNAQAFANGEYQAQLNASDNASGIIQQATGTANAFAITYTGTLSVNDEATGTINNAYGSAAAFASEYDAVLYAQDEASGVIATVSNELDNLNGKTATTYVQTVQVSSLPASGGQLGKTILPRMAHGGVLNALNSRAVLVGEAGPEIALLPLGTQVVPHGASLSRMANGGTVTNADGTTQTNSAAGSSNTSAVGGSGEVAIGTSLKSNDKASSDAGQKDMVSYFKGALSEIRQQKSTLHDAIFGPTVFSSAAAAKPALQGLDALDRKQNTLSIKLDHARQQSKRAGKDMGDAFKTAASAASTATTATSKLGSKIDALRGSLGGSGGGGGGGEGSVGQQAIGALLPGIISSLGQATGDTQQMTNAVDQTQKSVDKLDGSSTDIKTDVDTSQWDQFVNDLNKVDGSTVNVNVKKNETTNKSNSGDGSDGGSGGGGKHKTPAAALGRTILPLRVPAAAMGRIVQVGEYGPELVNLPFGSQVIPHGAGRSRLRGAAASGGGTTINIYGALHVHADTPDLARTIAAQVRGSR